MSFQNLPAAELITILVLGLVYPVYSLFSSHRSYEMISKSPKLRTRDYFHKLWIFTTLTIIVLLNLFITRSESFAVWPGFNLPAVVFFTLIILFIAVQVRQRISYQNAPELRIKMESIWVYMPKSREELKYYIWLSLAAAVAEELVFRFYLFHVLAGYGMSVWLAIVVVNVLFALTHMRGGISNMFSSLFLGIIFSVIYYYSSLLILPILLHAAIEIHSGYMGYRVHKMLLNNT